MAILMLTTFIALLRFLNCWVLLEASCLERALMSDTSASNPTIQPLVIVCDNVELGVMHVEEDTVEDLEEDQGADDSDEENLSTIYDLLHISYT